MDMTEQTSSENQEPCPSFKTVGTGHLTEDLDMSVSLPTDNSLPESASNVMEAISHQESEMAQPRSARQDNKVTTGGPPLTRDVLYESAQRLIDEINLKRKRDTTLLEKFRKAMEDRVAMSCRAVEEQIYCVYDRSSKEMQPKLQELFATLDRVAALEEELEHFRQVLGVLCKDLQQTDS